MKHDFDFDVFLSYSSFDEYRVRALADRLRQDGLKVWFDKWQIRPGDNIQFKIEEGLKTSRVLVLCMSSHAFASDWAQLESGTFRFRDPLNRSRRFLPLRLDESPIPGSLAQFRYIDWHDDQLAEHYQELLNACRSEDSTLQSTAEQSPCSPKDTIDFKPSTLRDALTIVVPVYNEASNIEALIKGLRAERFLERCRVIICDDASTDNSFALMREYSQSIPTITCIRESNNTQKVGATRAMMSKVATPFVLTLDADCMLIEQQPDALLNLVCTMIDNDYAAACFRIIPTARNWLGRLQQLDYAIFTDSLRRDFGVPLCLVGQGVLWRTDCFRDVLSEHSGHFDGDDLENTVIALRKGLHLYWEPHTLTLSTKPKDTVLGLIRQRALSWEYGMFRVLAKPNALSLPGNSGAFYRNVILMDFLAHPLRLIALPMLLGVLWYRLTEDSVSGVVTSEWYWRSIEFSWRYGPNLIVWIWVVVVLNSAISTRARPAVVLRWALFSAVYLSSPFVFTLYFPLVTATDINIYDILGAAVHWLGLGLILTYAWWVAITAYLLSRSSLSRHAKLELIPSTMLAPLYYGTILLVCKTVGLCKAVIRR